MPTRRVKCAGCTKTIRVRKTKEWVEKQERQIDSETGLEEIVKFGLRGVKRTLCRRCHREQTGYLLPTSSKPSTKLRRAV